MRPANRSLHRLSIAIVALLFLTSLVTCAAPPGRRLLKVEYALDGTTMLTTRYEDGCTPGAAEVWSYLAAAPLVFSSDGDDADPLGEGPRRRFEGAVSIRVVHAGRTIAEAQLKELTLVRDPDQPGSWHLDVAEMERTRVAAGLASE